MKFTLLASTFAEILLLVVTQVSCVTLPAYCETSDSGACNRTEYLLIRKNCREIRRLMFNQTPQQLLQSETESEPFACFDDIVLTLTQSSKLLEQVKLRQRIPQGSNRKRRAGLLRTYYSVKWTSPIKYKVEKGISDLAERYDAVHAAIEAWTNGTCLTFEEIPYELNLTEPHLLFTLIFYPTCSSYIGITPQVIPQPLFLGFLCYSMGIVAHELGHALGLIHEHQRPDRDQYINILPQNTIDDNADLFILFNGSAIQTYGQSYDYGSSMQYRGTAYSKNGLPTIETKDSLFQNTLGQREEISFWDYYAVNQEYCSDACRGRELPQPCLNRGYQDPKDCSQCRCPDGWSGRYCDSLAAPVNAECGGLLNASEEARWITFPSPRSPNPTYEAGQECSWLIQSRPGSRVSLRFQGEFSVACSISEGYRCLHWVEIHYRDDLGLSGPRFCCNTTYTDPIVSATNRMLITFKAITTGIPAEQRGGFTFVYSEETLPVNFTDTSSKSSTVTPGPSTKSQTQQFTSSIKSPTFTLPLTPGFFTNSVSNPATSWYASATKSSTARSIATTEGFFTEKLSSPLLNNPSSSGVSNSAGLTAGFSSVNSATETFANTQQETTYVSSLAQASYRFTGGGFTISAAKVSIYAFVILALFLLPVR